MSARENYHALKFALRHFFSYLIKIFLSKLVIVVVVVVVSYFGRINENSNTLIYTIKAGALGYCCLKIEFVRHLLMRI